MSSAKSHSCLNVLPLLLLRVAFPLALALFFTGAVGGYAEARHLRYGPDLIVSAVSAQASASSGATIGTSTTVKNQGRATSSASSVSYYLSTSASSISGASLLGVQSVASLPAGTSIALVTSLAIPPSTPGGTFYLVGVADSAKVVLESNENNNLGSSGAISVKDSTPPTISSVTGSGITASSVTVTWKTDKPSSSQVEHGTTAAYGSSTSPGSSLVTSHAVTVSGLTAGKAYHFRVHSKDATGNAALSSDYTFTTPTTAAPATGNTYYVATTGSDTNPGTDALPFRTLSHGVSVLTPGDTLYIASGTYAESLIHTIPPGTSWEQPVTVAAYPGHTVTLKPGPGAGSVLRFIGPQQYIIIDGLILDGTNADNEVVKITTGGSDSPAHHIRLQNSELRNSTGQGVLVTGIGADQNEFMNLNIHDNGRGSDGYDHGMYISSSYNVIENSSIHNNIGYGVHIYNGYTGRSANNNLVRNNKVFANGWRGILLGSGNGNMAYNNVVWGNRGGIRIGFFNPTNNQVYNNTVYDNTDWGIWVQQGTGAVVQNNIVYKNGAPELQDSGTGSVIANNFVGIDPQFVNAAAGDFRLQPGSPAIDAGTTLDTVTIDFAGIARPQGAASDIGAFESPL